MAFNQFLGTAIKPMNKHYAHQAGEKRNTPSKVTQFHVMSLRVKKEILRFDITVTNPDLSTISK